MAARLTKIIRLIGDAPIGTDASGSA